VATPEPMQLTNDFQLEAFAMCSLVEGFRCRFRGVTRLGILLAVVCLGAGCEAIVNRQYSHDVGELSNADRIIVTFAYRSDPVSRTLELPPAVTITDPRRVAAAAAIAGRYQDGWRAIFGGSPPTNAAFYQGERLLGNIQLFSTGISHEGYARTLPPAVVAELVDVLGIRSQFMKSP
jgi:hypothetical protein